MCLDFLKKHDEGLRFAEEVNQLFPDNSEFWMFKGSMLNQFESYEPAISALKKAIVIEPDFAIAKYVLVQTLNTVKRYKESTTILEEILRNYPADTDAQEMLEQTQSYIRTSENYI